MISEDLLSTHRSFGTAWQLGQFRLRQELKCVTVLPQFGQISELKPSAPVLQFIIAQAAFLCSGERGRALST